MDDENGMHGRQSSGAQNVRSSEAVGGMRTVRMQMSTGLDAFFLSFPAQVFVDRMMCLWIHGLLLDSPELPVIHSVLSHGHGCLFFLFVVVQSLCEKHDCRTVIFSPLSILS
uniref:Uncharacterized protein n=1 Tax=Rhipicephalus appendiculatus TaxID=34631 RepID=A0A131YB88_RHIAP